MSDGKHQPNGEIVIAALEMEIQHRRQLGGKWVERLGNQLWEILASKLDGEEFSSAPADFFTNEVERTRAMLLWATRLHRGKPRADPLPAIVSCLEDASRALDASTPVTFEGEEYTSAEELAVAVFRFAGMFLPEELRQRADLLESEDIVAVLRVHRRSGGRPQKGDEIGDKWTWIASWIGDHLGMGTEGAALKKAGQRLKRERAESAAALQQLKDEGGARDE